MQAYTGAFVFGLTLAIAIGPIALLILRAGLEHGFAVAARCGLGAASADLLYALAAFGAGAFLLPRLEAWRSEIELGGALLLIALGLGLAVSSWRAARGAAAAEGSPGRLGYLSTFALTLVNPLTIVLFASFASQLGLEARGGAVLDAALAIFTGSLVVQLALAAMGALLHRGIRDRRVIAGLNLASGLGIAAFGLRGLT